MTTNQEQSKQPKIKNQPNPTQTNQPKKQTRTCEGVNLLCKVAPDF